MEKRRCIKTLKTELCEVSLSNLPDEEGEDFLIVVAYNKEEGWTIDEFIDKGFFTLYGNKIKDQLDGVSGPTRVHLEESEPDEAYAMLWFTTEDSATEVFPTVMKIVESLESEYK